MHKLGLLCPSIVEGTRKSTNFGDVFIERAIQKLVPGEYYTLSTRTPPTEGDYEKLNQCSLVLIAGANQLSKLYQPLLVLSKLKCPVTFFGVGIGGDTKDTSLSSDTIHFLLEILERTSLSLRDVWAYNLLLGKYKEYFLRYADKIFLTGCPVIFANGVPQIKPQPFNKIIVSVTTRGKHLERDLHLVHKVKKKFPESSLIIATHTGDRYVNEAIAQLYNMVPSSVDDHYAAYNEANVHIGSRLHGHLLMTSLRKPSYLFRVDYRHDAFSDTFSFPLDSFTVDQEAFRQKLEHHHVSMKRFLCQITSHLS